MGDMVGHGWALGGHMGGRIGGYIGGDTGGNMNVHKGGDGNGGMGYD